MTSRIRFWRFVTANYFATTAIATLGGFAILYASRAWGSSALARTFPVVLLLIGLGFLFSSAVVTWVAWNRFGSPLTCLALALGYALLLVATFAVLAKALNAVFPWLTSFFGAPPAF